MKKIKTYKIFNESSEIKYKISDYGVINGIEINEEIFQDEAFEYTIRDREEFIDELIQWISEATGHNKVLMIEDLKELINLDDEFIFSSISTNYYIYKEKVEEFNETCQELLDLSKNYHKILKTRKFNL